jgi:diguanylate cyclase (GGDEF)-like protein
MSRPPGPGLAWLARTRRTVRARRGLVARSVALTAVAVLSLTGRLGWFEAAIGDARFAVWNRPPSGHITLVDIDEASIAALGRWPWGRAVHARLIDALLKLDADTIAFDVDFSSPSSPEGDAALEAALKRAEGGVILAALRQRPSAHSARDELVASRPLPSLAAHAWEATVSVVPDPDGSIRALTREELFGVTPMPSMAALLASTQDGARGAFLVDYGILEPLLDHVSAIDLLQGRVDKAVIAGRKVLIGATAVELRDFFQVPRFGPVPGPTLQAMAAESLLQGRALRPVDPGLSLALTLLLLTGVTGLAVRLKLRGHLLLLAGTAVVAEAMAIAVQSWFPLVPSTAPAHAGLLCFSLIAIALEVDARRVGIVRSRSEADRLRVILDRVIADSFAGVVVVDHDGTVRAISAAAASIIGLPAGLDGHPRFDEVLPGPLSATCADALARAVAGTWRRRPTQEIEWTGAGDTRIVLDCVTTLSRVPGPVGLDGRLGAERFAICLSFEDVTEKRAAEARLVAMARIDALTGLPNRRVLLEGIEVALGGVIDKEEHCAALLFFDLDRFKIVNDRLGHTSGDALLVAVADRIRLLAGPGDLAARLGGDEFALLVERPSLGDARRFAEDLIAAIAGVHEIGPYQASIGVSVGMAVAGHTTEGGAKTLMRNADAALTEAKSAAGDVVVVFDAAMEHVAESNKLLEQDLRDGLLRDEFTVLYQRQVDLVSGAITGVEALLRWRHPRDGFVSPARFIPIAERTGLIEPLGAWVLRTACREAVAWPLPIKVSVNLSAVQLSRGDLVGTVLDALAEAGLPAARLDLELTESLLMEDDDIARGLLNRLRQAGVGLSLDDFGTGYSSLSYLRTFAIDKIKIDQSFVRDLPGDRSSMAIIGAVVGMAQGLGLRVNAEGVETPEQLKLLAELGCHEVQGYLHGRPEPAPAIAASLLMQRDASGATPGTPAPSRMADHPTSMMSKAVLVSAVAS